MLFSNILTNNNFNKYGTVEKWATFSRAVIHLHFTVAKNNSLLNCNCDCRINYCFNVLRLNADEHSIDESEKVKEYNIVKNVKLSLLLSPLMHDRVYQQS